MSQAVGPPTPGKAPIRTPMLEVRSMSGKYLTSSLSGGTTRPTFWTTCPVEFWYNWKRTSERPKSPSLEHQDLEWRIAYISALLSAIKAGLPVGVARASSLSNGLRELTPEDGFPTLPVFDVTLTDSGAGLGRVATALTDFLRQKLAWAGSPSSTLLAGALEGA